MEKHNKGQVVDSSTKQNVGITKQEYQQQKEKEKIAIMGELGMHRAVYNKTQKYKKITNGEIVEAIQEHFKRKIEVDSQPLKEWAYNIPLGVLYKVKEAKEDGFEDFRVYFPTVVNQNKRLKDDPIVIGYKKMKPCRCSYERELFAYDNSIDCCFASSNFQYKGKHHDNRQKYQIATWG